MVRLWDHGNNNVVGALILVGLPPHDIPPALLMFNPDVELGQIMFIAAILLLIAALRRLFISWHLWILRTPSAVWRLSD
jgi:hypothetical protein